MGNKLKSRKKCPFCFSEGYLYKTKNGLMRHVMFNHMYDNHYKLVYPGSYTCVYLRVETAKGSTFIKIKDWAEVEEFLEDYVTGYRNPSKRSMRFWKYVTP